MKKQLTSILILLFCVISTHLSFSQETGKNALGLRLGIGTNTAFGHKSYFIVDGVYLYHFSQKNRLEINLNATIASNQNSIGLRGFYEWVWQIKNGWYWYTGPGVFFEYANNKNSDDDVSIGITGTIGIEYRFPKLISLSLDYHPAINILGLENNQWWYNDIGFGIRFHF